MKLFFKMLDELVLFPLRYCYLARILGSYFTPGWKVLDVGASCGRLARAIQKTQSIVFMGVDTHIQPRTCIPIVRYDGKNLPFKDNSFDCVMIIDVLHHCKDMQRLIGGVKRVSRKYILIKDHYWSNWCDLLLLKLSDYIGNKPYGVALPYNFLSLRSWNNLFKKNKFDVTRFEMFRYNPFDVCKHVIFQLRK